MASSSRKTPALYAAATTAPPPTPSSLPSSSHVSSNSGAAAADLLSNLLHRLPPILSLPNRRHAPTPTAAAPLPTLSFTDEWSAAFITSLSCASSLGFFELSGHGIPLELARSAEAEALALFHLPHDEKLSYFPRNWPLGYENGDESAGDGDACGDSFCLDSQCSSEPAAAESLHLAALRGFTGEMDRVGLRVVEWLTKHAGFESHARMCSFMWVDRGSSHGKDEGQNGLISGGSYPFAVGLTYQIRCGQKYSLLADSGRVPVRPEVGSILVTIGDISQVWSNGKLKKVRGRPIPVLCPESNSTKNSSDGAVATTTVTMSLLITLPLQSTVSPFAVMPETDLTRAKQDPEAIEGHEEEEDDDGKVEEEGDSSAEKAVFDSFWLEDYAWRVYHERLSFKDPLDRYRIGSA
ncbi:hypothetical protein SAY87_006854 [Trapa incisa]|uniref:Non-haem dioxygenase N-terminal domain-containing protein n=1 Tax=Trapa incisa TaxID=236973 RepID=A0AAN7K1U3_9MYRT|nr:hypothetical protein SAY87_006854 [Trapa incisa]